MKKHRTLFSLALVIVCACSVAQAQSKPKMPNLLGTWECRGQGILLGQGNHVADPALTPTAIDLTTTYVFTSQDGHRVIGTRSSALASEQLIGVVDFDNRTVEMVDEDGFITWTVTGKRKATSIYREATSTSMVAARAHCQKQ